MMAIRDYLWIGFVLAFPPIGVDAQQVSDETFSFRNAQPAFASGTGPIVCVDRAHFNFHTADGRYKPFANLLRADGYRVENYDGNLTREALGQCGLLVIANPLAAANAEEWTYPHPSAFSGSEIEEVMRWVRSGGRLLLFADHAPIAAAARDLAAVFGVVMLDAYVDGGPGPDLFRRNDETLRRHPIREGRNPAERVDSVRTFTGQAMQITHGWDPLLVFGPEAVARLSLEQSFQEGSRTDWPTFSVGGWVHGAAREWDAGRVVFLGEAAMCSAQVAGPQRTPMGMNDPLAGGNAQFCLNVVRWLTGAIHP